MSTVRGDRWLPDALQPTGNNAVLQIQGDIDEGWWAYLHDEVPGKAVWGREGLGTMLFCVGEGKRMMMREGDQRGEAYSG